MRVLVTWGSKLGGTEGIARMIGDSLRQSGFDVTLRPADAVARIDAFQAVIVGGALYANRWHRAARRFVARNADDLRRVPVWFFSSGPLDDSASQRAIPPSAQVRALMDRIGARDHVTFGGRLAPDARGFPAAAMAKKLAGDWRDRDRIEAWARELAVMLPTAHPGTPVVQPARSLPRLFGHAAIGWAATAAITTGLLALTDLHATIVLRAIASPAIFALVAWHYFKRSGARDPLPTAIAFVGVAAALDLAIVGGLVDRGIVFGGVVGPLLPFVLVFAVTWSIGWLRSTMPWPKPAATRGVS